MAWAYILFLVLNIFSHIFVNLLFDIIKTNFYQYGGSLLHLVYFSYVLNTVYCFIFFFIGKQKISFRRPGHSCYFQYIEFLQLFHFCSLFLKKKNLYFQKTNLIKTVDQSFSFPSGGFAIIKQKSHRPNASIWG